LIVPEPVAASMILDAAAFVLGAWGLQQQALLPGLTGAMALVPLAMLAWWAAKRGGAGMGLLARLSVILCWGLAGFFWSAATASWKLGDALDRAWEGRDVELRGVVAEMTQPSERGVRFRFDVEQVYSLGAIVPGHLSLVWYHDDRGEAAPDLRPGQRWRLVARLRRPHGTANPDGFDFEAWMLERGIRATGYVVAKSEPQLLSPVVHRPGYWLERLRESIRTELLAALADRPYAGVIVALVIGDQRAIPPAQWQVFTRTGVNHLMSISGLHITMVASLAFVLVLRVWRRSSALATRLPALRAAAVAGFLAAAGYAALTGFAVPAQRTVCMLAVVAVALWLGWAMRPLAVLAAAAAVTVAVDPMAVNSPGFWLSFGAVAVIMLAGGGRLGRANWLDAWMRTQWAVTLALIPLLLAMFQQVSLISPLANAVAIPLVSLVVVPFSLLAAAIPFDLIALGAHSVMTLCMAYLQWLNALPEAVWQQHAPPDWAMLLAGVGALWILLPKGMPARWVGALLFLPLFLATPAAPRPGELWLTVLDVGQGLAVVARTSGHAVLYDTGPAYSDDIDAGERIVVPYMRAAGVRRLDGLIVSHGDLDHSGGALSVLRAMPVDWFASSLSPLHPISRAAGRGSRRCAEGQHWDWDGVRFEILYPDAASYNDDQRKDNDRSCVLRIVSPHGSVLLPADIERAGERALLRSRGADLSTDVLVVPHHGSRTSSTPEFVGAVSPRLAIFAMGYRNRFGHPHPAVVAEYRRRGVNMLRTDMAGAVSVKMTAEGVLVQNWREMERRYWRDRQGDLRTN
ncbi:MAG TPA: DNA internalization-related competence protein ComEC/Rec2, partial [Burkholderiales bacterium]